MRKVYPFVYCIYRDINYECTDQILYKIVFLSMALFYVLGFLVHKYNDKKTAFTFTLRNEADVASIMVSVTCVLFLHT